MVKYQIFSAIQSHRSIHLLIITSVEGNLIVDWERKSGGGPCDWWALQFESGQIGVMLWWEVISSTTMRGKKIISCAIQ